MSATPERVSPVPIPTHYNQTWLVLGDDDCIVRQNKIIAVSSDNKCVTLHLDNRSVVSYNALSIENAKQEVSEIINILLERNVNEKS